MKERKQLFMNEIDRKWFSDEQIELYLQMNQFKVGVFKYDAKRNDTSECFS